MARPFQMLLIRSVAFAGPPLGIVQAIHDDDSLSTYAHNIKIIAQDGKVTLRGPVRSEDEKNNLQAKAVAVAGEENVINQLEIAPSK
jgi:osmotically-inducible protein OsmY